MKEHNCNNVHSIPEWAKDAIWYQIFPERFRKSGNVDLNSDYFSKDLKNWKISDFSKEWYSREKWECDFHPNFYNTVNLRRYGGNIKGIKEKIHYLLDLGINAVYLTPIFMARSNHKYDSSCLHHIDPYFGSRPEEDIKIIKAEKDSENPENWKFTQADKEFLELIKIFHDNNIKVIIDGVFNHSGTDFFAFKDIIKNGENSKYYNWYNILGKNKDSWCGFDYSCWLGHGTLPEFKREKNTLNNEVKKYIFNCLKRWMTPDGDNKNGVDGWRLDAADQVPHKFWKEFRKEVKSLNKEAYLTGEIWQIEKDYFKGDEFDALMNYPFAYLSVEFFVQNKGVKNFFDNCREIFDSYSYNNILSMQNLYSSHDTARLNNIISNPEIVYRNPEHFRKTQLQHNYSYKINPLNKKQNKIRKSMIAFQFTFPGSPMIYYGDEVGMEGANDPDCRKPMLWDDIVYENETKHPVFGCKYLSENIVDKELFKHYKRLIKIRKENIALRRGSFKIFSKEYSKEIIAFERNYQAQNIKIFFNNSNKKIIPDKNIFEKDIYFDLYNSKNIKKENIVFLPYSFLILT